ncbi:hypothetical protein [Maritimibacter sp. 55A14]|uniref:hypothetical protein n=1 Tax=Maritimibacter sp. 55A14 TaxID=2174844 RepID=UPI0011B23616|nr:hypothetical protein [Maritimibacter sp. 55A14]
MAPSKLNVQKAALYGVFFGMAFSVIIGFSDIHLVPVARIVGRLIGGAFGGAVLFAVVAAIADLLRK